jgi:hypothetical protein
MADPSTSLQVAVITGAITAGATIAAALLTWLKDRNGAARRIQALDEAQKYVEFWTTTRATIDPALPSDLRADAEERFREHISFAEGMVATRGTYKPGRNSRLLSQLSTIIIGNAILAILIVLVFFGATRLLGYVWPATSWAYTASIRVGQIVAFTTGAVILGSTVFDIIKAFSAINSKAPAPNRIAKSDKNATPNS